MKLVFLFSIPHHNSKRNNTKPPLYKRVPFLFSLPPLLFSFFLWLVNITDKLLGDEFHIIICRHRSLSPQTLLCPGCCLLNPNEYFITNLVNWLICRINRHMGFLVKRLARLVQVLCFFKVLMPKEGPRIIILQPCPYFFNIAMQINDRSILFHPASVFFFDKEPSACCNQ